MRECLDTFQEPECEAFDVFVNGVLCVAKGVHIHVSRELQMPPSSTETTRTSSQDFQVQLAVGQCPRIVCIMLHLLRESHHRNYLTDGKIPESIGKLASVEAIDLSMNKLSGAIPSSIGTIPESLKQLRYLKVLDLSFNQLNCSVPIWIANESVKEDFNFSYNRYAGEVPDFGRLKNHTRSSLIGNANLCGGSILMGLKPCVVQKRRRKLRKWSYLLLAIISGSLLLSVFFSVRLRYFFKKKAAESEEPILMASPSHHGGQNFTQRELEIATNGFNDANLLGRGSFGSVYKAWFNDGKSFAVVKKMLLLVDDMVAHVADFGIGKLIFSDKPTQHSATTTSVLRRSDGYIPPEYGQGTEVSVRGGVYSFGVMLLELITRQRPTSQMFADGYDLRKWVNVAFPHNILEVVDM